MEIIKEDVFKRIKELREEKELTLEQWGTLFDKDKSTASRWERQTVPHKETLNEISSITGKSVDWILYGTYENYVINFIKQFPKVYEYLKKNNHENFFEELSKKLYNRGHSYKEDIVIIKELICNKENGVFISYDDDVIKFLKKNDVKIKDFNEFSIENNLIYRMELLPKLERYFQKNLKDKDLLITDFDKLSTTLDLLLENKSNRKGYYYKNNFYDKDMIAYRVKIIIKKTGLSLSEFSSRLINKNNKSLSKSTLNSYIRGLAVPPIHIANQIALLGDTTIDWIYTGKE